MRTLPRIVNQLCVLHDAWIVGRNMNPVRDYDVIVSFANWRDAAALIPTDAQPNSFGGWKFNDEGKSVDVWPGEMAWLMTNAQFMMAWHPRTGREIFVSETLKPASQVQGGLKSADAPAINPKSSSPLPPLPEKH